jgi:transcriptional regulator with XRE-family HTH domain
VKINNVSWLSKRLKQLRKEKRLTIKSLGSILNLAESTISGYETGARKPDLETVEKFADFFDVSVDYLSGRSEIRNAEEIARSRVVNDSGTHFLGGPDEYTKDEIEYAKQTIENLREMIRREKENENK